MVVLGDDVYITGASDGNDASSDSSFYYRDTYIQCWKNEQVIFRDTVLSYGAAIFMHQNDIYLGGHLSQYASSNRIACYWKNGERHTLTNENQDATVKSLFVSDTHVYAAGSLNGKAVYWTDGVRTDLSNDNLTSSANSIFVQGADVYVAGAANKHPAVWKNNVRYHVTNENTPGEIDFIFVGK